MTPSESLLVRNLLNGVPMDAASAGAGLSIENAETAFREAMRRVAEYQFVHCLPHFPVNNLIEARRNRMAVLGVLDAIADWDGGERALALDILAGRNVLAEGCDRDYAERVINRVLDALPHYLERADQVAYYRDRKAFLRAHRGRVRETVERFVSFRAPLLHGRIVTITTGNPDELLANLRQL